MVLSFLKGVFSSYNAFIIRRPLIGISASTGVILGLGDILEQVVEGKKYDHKRTICMSIYGLVIYGPFCSLWYNNWLPKLAPLSDVPSFKQLALKIFYDETLQSSLFYGSFLYMMTRLEGGSHQEGKEKVKKDFFRCYLADLAVWPWIQYLNFMYVPPHLQAIVVSSVTVFWGAYISYIHHSVSTPKIIPQLDSLSLIPLDKITLTPQDPIALLRADPLLLFHEEPFAFPFPLRLQSPKIMYQLSTIEEFGDI